jgi:hypothetical protein
MTIHAPELYTPRKQWPPQRIAKHLLAHPEVCPAIPVHDLNTTEPFVRMVQRRLGIKRRNER